MNHICQGNYSCNPALQETRILPVYSTGNLIVCYQCYKKEIKYRCERNQQGMSFSIPQWKSLKSVVE